MHAVAAGRLVDPRVREDDGSGVAQVIVRIENYAWLVPYIESNDDFFLKTVIPSRKATRQYLGGEFMSKVKLNAEERELLDVYESGEFISDLSVYIWPRRQKTASRKTSALISASRRGIWKHFNAELLRKACRTRPWSPAFYTSTSLAVSRISLPTRQSG